MHKKLAGYMKISNNYDSNLVSFIGEPNVVETIIIRCVFFHCAITFQMNNYGYLGRGGSDIPAAPPPPRLRDSEAWMGNRAGVQSDMRLDQGMGIRPPGNMGNNGYQGQQTHQYPSMPSYSSINPAYGHQNMMQGHSESSQHQRNLSYSQSAVINDYGLKVAPNAYQPSMPQMQQSMGSSVSQMYQRPRTPSPPRLSQGMNSRREPEPSRSIYGSEPLSVKPPARYDEGPRGYQHQPAPLAGRLVPTDAFQDKKIHSFFFFSI